MLQGADSTVGVVHTAHDCEGQPLVLTVPFRKPGASLVSATGPFSCSFFAHTHSFLPSMRLLPGGLLLGRGTHSLLGDSAWDQDTPQLRGPNRRFCAVCTMGLSQNACPRFSASGGRLHRSLPGSSTQHVLIRCHPDADMPVYMANPTWHRLHAHAQ